MIVDNQHTKIADAQPGDIYADPSGKLWRILDVVTEPTVVAEEVEGVLDDPSVPKMPLYTAAQGIANQAMIGGFGLRASIRKRIHRAPTSSHLWFEWERIFRRAVPKDAP